MDALIFATTAVIQVYLSWRSERLIESDDALPRKALRDGRTLNADELICLVTADNRELPEGGRRAQMRLKNLWHRATYVLIRHEPERLEQHGDSLADIFVIVQKRSKHKDYCPGRFDPTPGGVVGFQESYLDNATREMEEEMGIELSGSESKHSLSRLFTFPYEDSRVRVWGEFYECFYRGTLRELQIQEEEVESFDRMSLKELERRTQSSPSEFMPDACHAMKLYFQLRLDVQVSRRLLKGYSSSDLDAYDLRPRPRAIFFDCDDCLYFDGWNVAGHLTKKIEEWCINHGLKPNQAYELYKEYGTAIRGLIAEGYVDDRDDAVDQFLQDVHDLPISDLLSKDTNLRNMLLRMDPSIPKYIFTASIGDHAKRCVDALGVGDLFADIIDCKQCELETKHSRFSFEVAMKVAGVRNPEECVFFDDSVKNIEAARQIGWRSVLVGLTSRESGLPVSSEHAELEIESIHNIEQALPELFI